MKNNPCILPRVLALIVAAIAILGFFLPYISIDADYIGYLETYGEEAELGDVNVKISDMKELSLFEYSKIYYYGGEALFGYAEAGWENALAFALPCAAAVVILIFAACNCATPIVLFSAAMAVAMHIVNSFVVSIGVMPSDYAVWGISHLLYYICAAALFALGIWLFVAKRRRKKSY